MLRWWSIPSPTQVAPIRTRHGLPGRIISTTAPRTKPMSASRLADVCAAAMETIFAVSPDFIPERRSSTAVPPIATPNLLTPYRRTRINGNLANGLTASLSGIHLIEGGPPLRGWKTRFGPTSLVRITDAQDDPPVGNTNPQRMIPESGERRPP